MNYTLFGILILLLSISIYYGIKKKKKTESFLEKLNSEYNNRFKIYGRVRFSSRHILIDCHLTVTYSENDILIYGYDNYNTRNTKFVFHTNRNIPKIEGNNIPNYLITNIENITDDRLIIKSDDDSLITILCKSYGKEKPQLKDEKFTGLISGYQ